MLRIPGKQVYQWVDRLAPHLDGSHTVEELTEGLSTDRVEMVSQLVEMLAGAGFVKDVEADRSHTLSAAEIDAYAREIAFIDYFCESAAARFQEFRHTRVVAIGSGQTVTALVAANLAVGLRNVEVMTTGECATDFELCQQHLYAARRRDPDQTLTVHEVPGWDGDEGAVRTALGPFDAVVHVCDRPMLARAMMLDRVCRAQGTVLVQAVVVGDQVWIGPLTGPDNEPAERWESAWRRLQATRSGSVRRRYAFTDEPFAPFSEYLTAATAALVANHASFEVFKHLTGISAAQTRSQMLRVDLETLHTTSHQFWPHPSCVPTAQVPLPAPELLAETVAGLARGEPLDEEEFSQRVRGCFDDELGLFTSIGEGDWHQLPLNVCRVAISNPALLADLDGPLTAVGMGTYLGAARRRAAQRACEVYAASVVDSRRLVQTTGVQTTGVQTTGVQTTGVQGTGQDVQVWGYDLAEQQPRLVPAAQVFPPLRGLVPSVVTAPGVASGWCWAEAVATALAAVCQALTVAGLDVDGAPFPLVDLEPGSTLDEDGSRYAQILRTWDVPVAVYEVTGALGIPSFAFCVGDKTVAYRTELDTRDALRLGLEQTLQYEQARTQQQPDYAPPDVADLPLRARGVSPASPRSSDAGDWIDRQHRLSAALVRQGYRVVVVPLDHDPVVTAVLPYLVNVVVEPRQSHDH
ncbi:MAG: TOMM precursor leader peptide-binding protein [Pseudonocardiaceae bacterium]